MAGVYRVGGTWHRQAGRDIAGAITTIRKRRAEEEEAARKAAKAAEKARKAAEAKAIKEKAKAEKLRKANLKEFGPHTDQELSDLGYSSKGHYRTAADEWGQLSTGDQKGYTDKQMEAELKRDAKAGGKGGKSKKGPNYRTKAEIKAAQKRMSGVTDLDEEVANIKSAQNQKEAIARALAKKKSVDEYAELSVPTQAEMQGMSYDDYSADIKAKERLAISIAKKQEEDEALRKANQKRRDAEASALRRAEAFENPITALSQTRRNQLKKLVEVGGRAGSAEEDTVFNIPRALTNVVRGKTYTERIRTPKKLSFWEQIQAGDYGGTSDTEYTERDVVHQVSQARIDNMAAGLTDEVLETANDVTGQAAHQIAVRMLGPVSRTEVNAQAGKIKAQIDRLVNSGAITLVDVTGMGDNMRVSAVTVDKLKEQLQDKIPGYIASGENRIQNIGGILVEYNPVIDKYFVIKELSGSFGLGNAGIRF